MPEPDTKSTTSATGPDRTDGTEQKKALDLSATQIVGGALAAMTAAYLGSRLSVAGTVIGAAVASVVAGVGGSVYTASLRHTRDRVKSVWTGKTNATPTEVVVTWDDTGSTPGATPASSAPPVWHTADDTVSDVVHTTPDDAAATQRWEQPGAPAPATAPIASPASASRSMWRSGRFWKRITVAALATFAVAAASITGLELVSGQALSGGQGTTVERVREPQAAPSESPSKIPSETPSPEPSETPSETPSPEPSETPDAAPSQAPASSAAPSAEPDRTEPSTPAPSADSPSAAAPSTSTDPSTNPAG